MKIRYLSDLHLEYIDNRRIDIFIKKIIPNNNEICILAGDIGNPYSKNYDIFIKYINDNFKKSFIICGNHEYYNNDKTIDETKKYLEEYIKQYNNISYLDNSYEYYDNYCFIGTTLWSHITNPNYKINDVYRIKNFNCSLYNEYNNESIKFLEDIIEKNNNCVIITHHVPSNSLIDIIYKTPKMEPYNQWFYCNLDNFILKNTDKIKLWIYGHTHSHSNKTINNIPFVCNPIGYPNENNNINFNEYIEIE